MNYQTFHQSPFIKIDTILSIHCFDYTPELVYPSRRYDFLEFIFVEKGAVTIDSSNGIYHLNKGDILFHNANVIHSIEKNSSITPVLTTAAFIAPSYTKHFFENKIFKTDRQEETIITELIVEAYNSYASDVDNYQLPYMTTASAAPFGAEQMLRLQLERLLIHLIRKSSTTYATETIQTIEKTRLTKQQSDDELFNRIVSYMEDNITTRLSIEKICKDNLVGRSKLQKLFKERTQKSVIDYFLEKKIDVAKLLISENVLNFTQISEHLGYSSVHFFSRQFKKITGLTPSEYVSLR